MSNTTDHTLALLRNMDKKIDDIRAVQERMQIDLSAMKSTNGAVLSMLGAFDDGARSSRQDITDVIRRVERMERRMDLIDNG